MVWTLPALVFLSRYCAVDIAFTNAPISVVSGTISSICVVMGPPSGRGCGDVPRFLYLPHRHYHQPHIHPEK